MDSRSKHWGDDWDDLDEALKDYGETEGIEIEEDEEDGGGEG